MAVEKVTLNDDIVLAEKPLPYLDVKGAKADQVVEVDSGVGCVDRFIEKMRQYRNYPPAQFAYHAFGNQRGKWTAETVKIMLDHARKYGLEVRAWSNDESAINLIVIKDPDTSDDSGIELYEKMQGKFDSYGLASFYEFEEWGVPICTDDDVEITDIPLPFGAVKIGKGKEWVFLH